MLTFETVNCQSACVTIPETFLVLDYLETFLVFEYLLFFIAKF